MVGGTQMEKLLVDRARIMRKEPTPEENKMWHILLKFLVTSITLKQLEISVVLLFYCVYLKGNLQRKVFFEI